MIDLHCHLLPGIDDGAADLAESLAMARTAVADGVTHLACTPHIYPGLYDNNGPDILIAVARLQAELDEAGVDLTLLTGADVQLAPDMVEGLRSGRLPSLADSRYFLFEPPHHVAPQRMNDVIFELLAAGYVPVITHPERLTWIEERYETICEAFDAGAWIQLTGGAVTGMFGRRARYWSERMLDEGRVHLIASDGHNMRRRRPVLSEAHEAAASRIGSDAALDLVLRRPQGVLLNRDPDEMPALAARAPSRTRASGWRRWFGG